MEWSPAGWMPVNSQHLRSWGREDEEFKVILSYIVSWRSAWDTWDPDSENQKKKRERKAHVGFINMYYISMIGNVKLPHRN